MEQVFFINPVAGKRDASAELVPQIQAAARQLQLPQPQIVVTQYAGQAREAAHRYAASGIPVALYACGGDGTLNELVQGAAGTALPGGPAANIPWYRNRYLRRRAGRSGGIWHPKIPAAAGMRGNSSLYALDSTGYAQPLRPQAARCDRRQRVYRYLYDGGHL